MSSAQWESSSARKLKMEKFATQLNKLNGLGGHIGTPESIARDCELVLHIAAEAALRGKNWRPFIRAWNALPPELKIPVAPGEWIPPLP